MNLRGWRVGCEAEVEAIVSLVCLIEVSLMVVSSVKVSLVEVSMMEVSLVNG